MERTQQKKWLVVLFFTCVSLVFGYFIYFLASGVTDPAYGQWLSNTQPAPASALADDSILLTRDQPLVFDRMKITYRGVEAENMVIDLVLMDLDSQYSYRHEIPLNNARQGFLLSNHPFKVASFNTRKVLLEHGPN